MKSNTVIVSVIKMTEEAQVLFVLFTAYYINYEKKIGVGLHRVVPIK